MDRGDGMQNGAEPSAVRLLPADGFESTDPAQAPPDQPRQWFVPLLVVLGVLAVFLFATHPTSNEDLVVASSTTLPPPITAVDVELIDLTTQPVAVELSDEWFEARFGWDGEIHDLLRVSSSFVAVGSNAEGAQAWLSGTGANWREAPFLELPDTAKTSLDHAVQWNGDVVALGNVDDGVGLWTADTLANWVYQGQIDAMGSNEITGLAAGPELLAVSSQEGQLSGWMSSDGLAWRSLGHLSDLDGSYIFTIAANEDWFFAAGQTDCDDRLCEPVLYRSSDGIRWEAADAETPGLLSTDGGMVLDMAVTAEGIIAVGWTGEFPTHSVAVWRSDDGSSWERVGADEPLFQPVATTVAVLGTRLGDNPGVTMEVNGDRYEVGAGSEFVTDPIRFDISEITSSDIQIDIDGQRLRIAVGVTMSFPASAVSNQVATEGPRIVVIGELGGQYSSSAAIWSSSDYGATWDRTTMPARHGTAQNVAIAGKQIVAFESASPDDAVVWLTTWDTTAVGATAVAALHSYLDALNSHDFEALAKLLPQAKQGLATPRFEIPSLGTARHEWWDVETGALETNLVAATVAYLEATDTAIAYRDCVPTVSLGATDRVTVICDFEVASALLTTLGYGDGTGRIQAAIAGGKLVNVAVNTSPSIQMWSTFSSGIGASSEADRATLFTSDETGEETFAPTFDGTTAATHVRLAARFAAGLLRPGETRVVETAFGTMEWRWIDPLDLPVYTLDAMTWSDLGFVGTAHGVPGEYNPDLSVWTSPDGLNWSEIEPPEGVESIWSLQPFHNGVAGQAWGGDGTFIIYFDGNEWTPISLPANETRSEDIIYFGVGGDKILAIDGTWGEESGPTIHKAWMIGSDLVPREVDLPSQDDWTEVNVGLAGNDDGFILSVANFYAMDDLSIWHTTDGFDWNLIADSAEIEDAQYVWNLQQHRSQYFVVGEGMELRCYADAQGDYCETVAGLWSSPDGVAWDRVLTEFGEPVATYEIGSGALGLVAFGQPSSNTSYPRSVYMSTDGSTWEQSADLSLLHPDVSWWWLNAPAVGDDAIVVAGSAYHQNSGDDADVPFLIVGRVIDS